MPAGVTIGRWRAVPRLLRAAMAGGIALAAAGSLTQVTTAPAAAGSVGIGAS
jgi:hypothetical protein